MSPFPAMRRAERAMPPPQIDELLNHAQYGILSMCAENGYGYGVPFNFARESNRIYFHCAIEGFKLRSLTANNRVSFCVVGKTQVLPSQFSCAYESVMVFGVVSLELNEEERENGLRLLLRKYCPRHLAEGEAYLRKAFARTKVLRLDMETVSGKSRLVAPLS